MNDSQMIRRKTIGGSIHAGSQSEAPMQSQQVPADMTMQRRKSVYVPGSKASDQTELENRIKISNWKNEIEGCRVQEQKLKDKIDQEAQTVRELYQRIQNLSKEHTQEEEVEVLKPVLQQHLDEFALKTMEALQTYHTVARQGLEKTQELETFSAKIMHMEQDTDRKLKFEMKQLEKELDAEGFYRENMTVCLVALSDQNLAAKTGYTKEQLTESHRLFTQGAVKQRKLERRMELRKLVHPTAKMLVRELQNYKNAGGADVYAGLDTKALLQMILSAGNRTNDELMKSCEVENIRGHITNSLSQIGLYRAAKAAEAQIRELPEFAGQKDAFEKNMKFYAYYEQHVKNILGDYGIDLDQPVYDEEKQEEKIETGKQAERWEQDFKDQQQLFQQVGQAPVENHAGENHENGQMTREKLGEHLRSLEREAGITKDEKGILEAYVTEQSSFAQARQRQELRIEARGNGQNEQVVRYRSNVLMKEASYERTAEVSSRLYMTTLRFQKKLEERNQMTSPELFKKLDEAMNRYVLWFNQKDEEKDAHLSEGNLIVNIRSIMQQIITVSDHQLEKQYVSMLMNFMNEEQKGNLQFQWDQLPFQVDARQKDTEYLRSVQRKTGASALHHIWMRDAKKEPLFPHEPNLKDIAQGSFGDCYFLASLAGIVAQNPQQIKNMMVDLGDGTVMVRFYARAQTGVNRYLPVHVRVTKNTPVFETGNQGTKDIYSRGALWTKILEKAYAAALPRIWDIEGTNDMKREQKKIDGGYAPAGGGFEAEALRHLLGKKASVTNIEQKSSKEYTGELALEKRLGVNKDDRKNRIGTMFLKKKLGESENLERYLNKQRGVIQEKQLKEEAENLENTYEILSELFMEEIEQDREKLQAIDNERVVEYMEKAVANLSEAVVSLMSHGGLNHMTPEEKQKIPKAFSNRLGKFKGTYKRDQSEIVRAAFAIYTEVKERLQNNRRLLHYQKDNQPVFTEYTNKEEEHYQKIDQALKEKKVVAFGTPQVVNADKNDQGNAGERGQRGIYGTHAYSVLGCESMVVNGVEKKFLKIYNPHARGIPLYILTPSGGLKRVSVMEQDQEYEKNTNGMFLMELRDFLATGNEITISSQI